MRCIYNDSRICPYFNNPKEDCWYEDLWQCIRASELRKERGWE